MRWLCQCVDSLIMFRVLQANSIFYFAGRKTIVFIKALVKIGCAAETDSICHLCRCEIAFLQQLHPTLKPEFTNELTYGLSCGCVELAVKLRTAHPNILG